MYNSYLMRMFVKYIKKKNHIFQYIGDFFFGQLMALTTKLYINTYVRTYIHNIKYVVKYYICKTYMGY